MRLEGQVVSLELAKKLKELGVKQESLFYWSFYDDGNSIDAPAVAFVDNCNLSFMEDLVSAFTVAELGEMFPINTSTTKGASWWHCQWWDGVQDITRDKATKHHRIPSETEADARAKMLVYLLEEGLISPPPAPVEPSQASGAS